MSNPAFLHHTHDLTEMVHSERDTDWAIQNAHAQAMAYLNGHAESFEHVLSDVLDTAHLLEWVARIQTVVSLADSGELSFIGAYRTLQEMLNDIYVFATGDELERWTIASDDEDED